jgi:hypothetical protein
MIATENLRGLESSPSRALMDSKHTWVRTFDCFGRGQILGAARHVNRRERRGARLPNLLLVFAKDQNDCYRQRTRPGKFAEPGPNG